VSWPARLRAGGRFNGLAALTDLLGLVSAASGPLELRDGHDLLGALRGETTPRDALVGMYGTPGTRLFKCMVRRDRWKYVWLANGGRELLFDLHADPDERRNLFAVQPAVAQALRTHAEATLAAREFTRAALDGPSLRALPFEPFPRRRIKQFARGVTNFGQPAVRA
jgi:arylsulfatase